ncbi:hypothetical protein ACVI1J_009746 [Bradyrhizobium diazoefficiens]|jgi:hypothetical protein|uniref:Uncharacterized protein n=1 Tax=Bradyrhizobium diazoefficiens TaxID=1355477 RepID=A0A0E4BXX3_9BRAD|nr:hypothetical protein [Bradyrhizobium japonicum]MBP1092199.1 hypothetical protein [Bradyrhizobium japonicum]BAR62904.1 hypothetical protein NK6_9769 [Bradyrhizobium diazoefficiens]
MITQLDDLCAPILGTGLHHATLEIRAALRAEPIFAGNTR